MAHTETRVSGETIFSGRIFEVTLDEVKLENGDMARREIVHHHGGACIAALTDAGEVYMVRQYRYAMGQELWELPAGKLEKGEDPFEAAKRELEEECGLVADRFLDLGPIYPTVGYCTEVIWTWAATGLHETAMHLDEDEFLTPVKLPLDKAVEMVFSGQIRDAKTVAALLKLAELRRRGEL